MQRSNPGFLHCRRILYHLNYQGSPTLNTNVTQSRGRRNVIKLAAAAAAALSLQLCPTLCDPIDSSPPGFPVPGILQATTLEWVAISFSNA